jgi:SOS response regulatory protein OraA/RecX
MTESIRSRKWGSRKWSKSSKSSTTDSASGSDSSTSPSSTRRTRSPLARRTYTEKTLKDLALFYVSRRETSRPRLQTYLQRKVNLEAQPEARDWIEEILQEFERTNIINHARFADMITREYARRGKGKRYIEQKLSEKGVGEQTKEIEFNTEDELSRAIELAIKTAAKSTIQKIEDAYARKQRLLQKLVTSGFDFGIAKKAVEVALKK